MFTPSNLLYNIFGDMMFYLVDNINNYDEYYYDNIYNNLKDIDNKKIDNYINDKDKYLCMLSRDMLSRLLSSKYSIDYNKIDIKYNSDGKPYTDNVYFNISHSYEYVLVGVSKKRLGVDIEKIRNVSGSLINYICTDKEMDYVINSKDKNKALMKIFCLKEAYYKMIGTGIRNLHDIEFIINDNDIKCSLNNNLNIILRDDIEGYIISVIEEKD